MASNLTKRAALALGATFVAGGLGEGAARLLLPPPPAPPVIVARNGEEAPGGEVAHFLALLGGAATWTDDRPHGRLPPNVRVRFKYPHSRWPYFDADHCIDVDFDSLGFHDDEFTVDKQPNELRILAIGDSFTFGMGVRLADSWPQVLERELQAVHDGPVQVVNGGFATGFFNPDGYEKWMASDGLRLHPDLVIVGLCLNDLSRDVPMLSYPVAPRTPVLGSLLLGEIARWFAQRRLMAERPPESRDIALIVRQHPEEWQGVQRALRELQAMLQQRGVPLVVAVLPMLSELDAYPYEGLHAMATAFCAEAGIRCVDLRHVFDGRRETDLWVDFADQHPNDVGQRLFADAIFDYLRREQLVR